MDFWEINNFSFFISRRCICWWIFSSIGIGKIYQRLCQSWHLGCYWNHSTIWMYLSHWQKIHSEWNYEYFQLKKTNEKELVSTLTELIWKYISFEFNWWNDKWKNVQPITRSDLNFFFANPNFFSPLFRERNNVYELGCELYWKTISWCSSHWYR